MFRRAALLSAVGWLGACSSGSNQGSKGANASGGSVSLGSNGGAAVGGSSHSGGDGSGNAGASSSSGFSGGGAGGANAAGGSTTASGGSSLDAGSDGSSGGNSGSSSAGSGGSGGAASCTATVDVSVNDATTGTGVDEFDYGGDWSTSEAPEKFDGDDHYSATTGATATLHFDGISAAWYAAKASHHGIATVSIDHGTPSDVDLYAATRADDVAVWNSGMLSDGPHTLVITVSGRQSAASTGTTVSVDRVVVERSVCDSPDGGTTNTGGTMSVGMARPSYNTGTGFFVVGSKLYDPKGAEFRIRGVDKLHWDADSPGIPKTHANTERWVIDFTQSSTTNLGLMQETVNNHIVPMPGNWQGTCDESADTLTSIVDTWVAQASDWKSFDPYMILNIANEWGPSSTVWRDSYITAISRLRAAGYLSTISVTSGGCGQDNDDLANYAAAVFASDPQKNVIFDQHIYGSWTDSGQSGHIDLSTGLDKLVATGLPIVVGEFGPGRNIGPSATDMTPDSIIQACEARGIGWMAWAWDDPASNADDTWFALSKNGDYASTDDLTMFGKTVVEDPTIGLLALAHAETAF